MQLELSYNETKSEIEKALRGTGIDWGRAKDGAILATWLAGHGLPFLDDILNSLAILDDNPEYKTAVINGLLWAEHGATLKDDWQLRCHYPMYLLAGMGIVASEQGVTLSLWSAMRRDVLLAVADNDDVWVNQQHLNEGSELILSTRYPSHIPKDCVKLSPRQEKAPQVSYDLWRKIGIYAQRCYVEETEEKRLAGAGAGDIDNS